LADLILESRDWARGGWSLEMDLYRNEFEISLGEVEMNLIYDLIFL